jgi:hypothetical protein
MSLLTHSTRSSFARCLYSVRTYAVARPNPRPKDPVLNSPNAKVEQIAPDVTFIHNPPSSVPTPYSLTTAPASPLLSKPSAAPASDNLPPALRPSQKAGEQTRLTQAQMNELRELRLSDPKTYSCQVLARKYGCSPVFVSMVAPLPAEQRVEIERERESAKAQWGERKTLIRAARKRRREFW